jgi:hypothetical protein
MSNTKAVFAVIGAMILVLAAGVGLSFYGNGLDYLINRVFSPANEQVRYNTFANSQAAHDSAVRDLDNYRMEYSKATTDAQRQIISSTVVHEFQTYDRSKLPFELQTFYKQMEAQ